MAASPLFVATMDLLRSKLRLSGVATTTDAFEQIEEATLEVRAGFIRRLGLTRVTTLVGYSSSETPSTENESLRLIAEITEVKWVRCTLLRTMTTMFLDGSGDALQNYHDEAAFRDSAPFEREREIKRLKDEIEENLQLLEGSDSIGSESTGHADTIGPDTAPPKPGETVFTYES